MTPHAVVPNPSCPWLCSKAKLQCQQTTFKGGFHRARDLQAGCAADMLCMLCFGVRMFILPAPQSSSCSPYVSLHKMWLTNWMQRSYLTSAAITSSWAQLHAGHAPQLLSEPTNLLSRGQGAAP